MKSDFNVFCNLCQKSFTTEDLQHHLNSAHTSNNEVQNALQFSDVFADTNDIRSHLKKCPEWIQKSFSFDCKDILDKKEMRSIIKRSYTHVYDDYETDCDICENVVNHKSCDSCGQQFQRKCHLKFHLLRKHISLPDNIRKSLNICETCGKNYPTKRILIQHHNRVHKKRSTGMNVRRAQTQHNCQFCDKKFANKSNLKRHVLNQHSEQIGVLPSLNQFTCDHCKCSFSNKSSVKRHIENLHAQIKNSKKSISCFHCEQTFNSIKYLNSHLTMQHNVKINEEELQFSHLNDFFSWKKEEEIRTNSRFVQLRGLRKGRRNGEEVMTLKFICNRSGIFHSKSNGKRAYRVKGSSKIGRYCSAYIEIMFKQNERVTAIYCSTHCGHDNDLRYLNLTMEDKREIYEKIQSGATFSSILNEIRNNVGKEIKRKHLVTNKDLHNIVTTFKKISKPTQDDTSAHSSSSTAPECSNDSSMEKNDQNFHNDLDLCADLWVDTCERMVNCFDQNESRINDPAKDLKLKNNYFLTGNVPQDSRIKEHCVNADFSTVPYINQHDYSVDNLPNTSQHTYKSTNHHSYESHTPEKLDDSMYSSSTKQIKDFCSMSSINDDFYPIEIIDVNDSILNNTKISTECPMEYNNDHVDRPQKHLREPNNVYDKLPNNSNVIVIPVHDAYDSYNYSDKLPSASNSESDPHSQSTDDEDPLNNDTMCYDEADSNDESETPAENKDKQEVSDLRDKVNSVTALYNIVESELDERKKNIIRNYVDNMFRVLQYRYNKSRTKKKQDSPKQMMNKEKKPKNQLQTVDKKRKKKIPDLIPAQFGVSAEYEPAVPDTTYSNSSHISIVGNTTERSDADLMRWDRY